MGRQPGLVIRTAMPDDAPCVARLSEQLGYPCGLDTIHQRLITSGADRRRMVFLACLDGLVAGWLEVGLRTSIESGDYAEILGLIVDGSARRRGVASALVEAARTWAVARGQSRLRVRTNVRRDDAAAFYAKQAFRETKQQFVLDCNLTESPRSDDT